MFPRLKERGPIEAAHLSPGVGGILAFPRLKERGPIEALYANHGLLFVAVSTLKRAWPH